MSYHRGGQGYILVLVLLIHLLVIGLAGAVFGFGFSLFN